MGVLLALALALGTLHGVVRVGPTTPVCRAGVPCSKPAGGAVLVFARRGHRSARIRTCPHGRYSVRLAPGVWSVTVARKPSIGAGIRPRRVHAIRGVSLRIDFSIDTGIR